MTFIDPRPAMPRPADLPAYLMIKPPPAVAVEIDRQRMRWAIPRGYGRDRLHITLLPLGDARDLGDAALDRLDRGIATLAGEPFPVCFDRLIGDTLHGGGGLSAMRAFQAGLVARLRRGGLRLPDYRFRPHISLAYGRTPNRSFSIAPIVWHVDSVMLIVSHHGQAHHETMRDWSLETRQAALPFAA